MRRIILAGAAVLLALGVAHGQALKAIVADTHQSGAAGFQGVGDALSGAKAHWGVIAYSAAQRGQNMLRLCNIADVACADVASDATTGFVSSTQVVGLITCGTGLNLCTVKAAYDDSGTLFCTGSVRCDQNQSTEASRPTFVPNCIGSLPCLQIASSQSMVNDNDYGTLSQPISKLGAISIPADPGTFSSFFGAGGSAQIGAKSGSNAFNFDGGGILGSSGTLTNDTFYSILGTQDGSGNGTVAINGTTTTGSVGTSSASTKFYLGIGGGNQFAGKIIEAAVYDVTFSGGNITSLTSAMRTNGGY